MKKARVQIHMEPNHYSLQKNKYSYSHDKSERIPTHSTFSSLSSVYCAFRRLRFSICLTHRFLTHISTSLFLYMSDHFLFSGSSAYLTLVSGTLHVWLIVILLFFLYSHVLCMYGQSLFLCTSDSSLLLFLVTGPLHLWLWSLGPCMPGSLFLLFFFLFTCTLYIWPVSLCMSDWSFLWFFWRLSILWMSDSALLAYCS